MEAVAYLRHFRISPRKIKILADLIRGKKVDQAVAILMNKPNIGTEPMLKLLNSAIANATNNFSMDMDKLFVSQAFATPGPILKRIMPRARGSASRIYKRTSHITIAVAEKE